MQDDPHTIIETVVCETASDLMKALSLICERDPRGEDVGQETAVCIAHKKVKVVVREFEDGTRDYVLEGV